MPTPMTMMKRPDKAPGAGHRILVAVADGRDGDDEYQSASPAVVMFAPGDVSLEVEDLEAAELEHEDPHEEQREERTARSVLDQGAGDVLAP